MAKPAEHENTDIQAPARITEDHVQDRGTSTAAGAPKAWRKLDGLAWLMARKSIASHQLEAGRRLQEDYELSQLQGGARSGGERANGKRSYDLPDSALDAGKRVKNALAILPPELVSMTILFLLPDFSERSFSLERIAGMVKEDKRAVGLGVRAGLSLLARHYGS